MMHRRLGMVVLGACLVVACGADSSGSSDDSDDLAFTTLPEAEIEVAAEEEAFRDEEIDPDIAEGDDPLPPEDEIPVDDPGEDDLAGDSLPEPDDPILATDDAPADGAFPVEDDTESGTSVNALAAPPLSKVKVFGLGVDADKAVGNPLFTELSQSIASHGTKLGAARIVVYPHSDLAKITQWVQATSAKGLSPFVAMHVGLRDDGNPAEASDQKTVPQHPQSPASFRSRFSLLLTNLPQVRQWAINESELVFKLKYGSSAVGRRKAALVGARYTVLAIQTLRSCKAGDLGTEMQKACAGMKIVAGEFAYQAAGVSKDGALVHNKGNNQTWAWFSGYLRQAVETKKVIHRRELPEAWSIHPYIDTSTTARDWNARATKKFIQFVSRTQKRDKLNRPGKSLRVWLTEVGTLLRVNGPCGFAKKGGVPSRVLNGKNDVQREAAYMIFNLAKLGVDRIYWWQFAAGAGHPWNSALVGSDGVTKYPSFYGLTDQPLPAGPKVCADGCTEFCQ